MLNRLRPALAVLLMVAYAIGGPVLSAVHTHELGTGRLLNWTTATHAADSRFGPAHHPEFRAERSRSLLVGDYADVCGICQSLSAMTAPGVVRSFGLAAPTLVVTRLARPPSSAPVAPCLADCSRLASARAPPRA